MHTHPNTMLRLVFAAGFTSSTPTRSASTSREAGSMGARTPLIRIRPFEVRRVERAESPSFPMLDGNDTVCETEPGFLERVRSGESG